MRKCGLTSKEYNRVKARDKRRLIRMGYDLTNMEIHHWYYISDDNDESWFDGVTIVTPEHHDAIHRVECTGKFTKGDISRVGNVDNHGENWKRAIYKPVVATHKKTGEQREYESLTKASEDLGMSVRRICEVLNGNRKSSLGWKFTAVKYAK